jgi:hypothetical protein
VSIWEHNKTSYKEKSGSTSDDRELYGIVSMVAVVVISVCAGIVVCKLYSSLNLKKRHQDQGLPLSTLETETKPRHLNDSDTSPGVNSAFCQALTPEQDNSIPTSSSSSYTIESTLHSFKGSCLEVEVGPKGGFYQSGDLSLLIPEGALLEKQKIRAAFHFEAPSTETTFTFSPILLLEPDNLHFNNIPVKIKFPYTARQGWMLHLKRKDSFRGWVTVLTVDTDTHETMSLDSHCKFSVYTGLLELRHFCEYKWCGRKKQTASEKFLGCTLYARMIPHGTRCHFILFLTDHCNDAYEVRVIIKFFTHINS